MKASQLINVPSFIITQEDEDGCTESPIWVQFYNGTISLEQEGESINILPTEIDKIFKAIKKHIEEAEFLLKNRLTK